LVIFRKRVAQLSERSLGNFVRRACDAAKLRGEVNVLITSNQEMRSLNARFRKKDKPTDVLSFPAEFPGEDQSAGDLAISAEMASQNARLLGHSPAEEIKILVLHGVLHLAGYDHEKDDGAMARREMRLRKILKLPVGLIERTVGGSSRGVKSTATETSRRRLSR
jgi:probable rRNA maturation factor